MNLAERAAATQATWDAWRGVPFSWSGATCIHVMADHLANMGRDAPVIPAFRTKKGAREAFDFAGLAEALDSLGLERIAPASMWVGDIGIIPGDAARIDGIRGAIAICAGNKFIGWHGAAEGFRDIDNIMPHVKVAFRV